ncbi:hypothetical protein [Oceanobacillus sp. Castelsardo]|uniref:hypothetical protein n=1 Tax=Oceanobacillus sp. Castelsardo TaxID=1851204 RepID=UPI000838FBBF|nr:hypothetical protein [Oceanobacillus sp. Castelsardo]
MNATTWQIISIVGYSLFGILLIAAVIMFFKMDVLAIIGDLTGKTAEKQIQAIREQNTKTGQKRYEPGAYNVERGELTKPVRKSRRLGRTGGTAGAYVSGRMTGTGGSGRVNGSGEISDGLAGVRFVKGQTEDTSPPIVLGDLRRGSFAESAADEERVNRGVDGTQVLADGMPELGEGTQVLVDGMRELGEGTQVLADGTQVLSDGTQVLADGTQVLADGTMVLSGGTQVLADGTQVLADGTQVLADGMPGETTVLDQTGELTSEDQEEIEFKVVKDVKIVHSDEVI